MNVLGEAVKGIKQLLLLQEQVRQIERAAEKQVAALGQVTQDLIGLDKRVVRIETMIEMSVRPGGGQPRIGG